MNWSKEAKRIVVLLIVAGLGALGVLSYAYQRHDTIENMEAKYTGTGTAFAEALMADADKWLNIIVILQGKPGDIDTMGFMLDGVIYCQFKDAGIAESLSGNQTNVQVKGRLIGYDDLLEEVRLDQCIILD